MSGRDRTVRRSGENTFELSLEPEERAFLASVASQMRELFDDHDDPARQRLFPDAYPDDVDRQTEYRLLVHDELASSHLSALKELEDSSGAEVLDEEQLVGWMRAVNQVRLVLGTRLGISEEGDERPASIDDPRATAFGLYDYLSGLQAEIVDALSEDLDDPDGEDDFSDYEDDD